MRDQILDFVRERRYVSFVELERVLGDAMSGDFNLEKGENVIIWSGVSEHFAEVFANLVGTGQVRLVPTTPLVYLRRQSIETAAGQGTVSLQEAALAAGGFGHTRKEWP